MYFYILYDSETTHDVLRQLRGRRDNHDFITVHTPNVRFIMVVSLVILINSLTVLIAPIRLPCCALSVATCRSTYPEYPRFRSRPFQREESDSKMKDTNSGHCCDHRTDIRLNYGKSQLLVSLLQSLLLCGRHRRSTF
jgi:hypothetical protein